MSSPTAEFPEPTPPADELTKRLHEVVLDLDARRTRYLEACTGYSQNPQDKQGAVLTANQGYYRQAFRNFLEVVSTDMDALQFSHQGGTFIQQEDKQRVEHLNGLMGGENLHKVSIVPASDEDIENAIASYDDEDEYKKAMVDYFAGYFVNGIESDTEKFKDTVKAVGPPKWQRIRHEAGKHALDVGKMTFAVAAGILISRLGGKPRNR